MTAISVECLTCHHRGILEEDDLAAFGEARDAPVAKVVKRLRCSVCGSASVRAFREVAGPPLAPRDNPQR